MYAMIPSPENTNDIIRIDEIKITKVHPDGRFDASSNGWAVTWANPDIIKIYDENDNTIDLFTDI